MKDQLATIKNAEAEYSNLVQTDPHLYFALMFAVSHPITEIALTNLFHFPDFAPLQQAVSEYKFQVNNVQEIHDRQESANGGVSFFVDDNTVTFGSPSRVHQHPSMVHAQVECTPVEIEHLRHTGKGIHLLNKPMTGIWVTYSRKESHPVHQRVPGLSTEEHINSLAAIKPPDVVCANVNTVTVKGLGQSVTLEVHGQQTEHERNDGPLELSRIVFVRTQGSKTVSAGELIPSTEFPNGFSVPQDYYANRIFVARLVSQFERNIQ